MSFVDHGENVFAAIVIDRDTDDEAIDDPHRLYVTSIGAGFDVLHEGRLVHRPVAKSLAEVSAASASLKE